jgi:hypothetical protein
MIGDALCSVGEFKTAFRFLLENWDFNGTNQKPFLQMVSVGADGLDPPISSM